MSLTAGTGITFADFFSALLLRKTATSIQKFRISSIVVDPIQVATGDEKLLQVDMGISGNHYQAVSTTRPLRIRLGKDYGDDGMWIVTAGASSLTAAMFPGTFGPTTKLIDVVGDGSYSLHIRFAWTDPT